MVRIRRGHAYAIRNAIHEAEKLIPRNDRSELAEYERDLVAQACVSLWDVDVPHVLRCLRRLALTVPRRAAWGNVLALALECWKPVEVQQIQLAA